MEKQSSFLILSVSLGLLLTFFTSNSFAEENSQSLEEQRQKAMAAQIEMITSKNSDEYIPDSDSTINLLRENNPTLREIMEDGTSNSVNSVKIKAIFYFDQKSKEITSFNVFKQIDGFDKKTVSFLLQGIVGIDKSLLYRAADSEYYNGGGPLALNHPYSEFDVYIHLEQGSFPIRKFKYNECTIANYSVDTLFDNDYSYNKASAFALVDNFTFTCHGLQPYHYDYESYIEKDGIDSLMKMREMKMKEMHVSDYSNR